MLLVVTIVDSSGSKKTPTNRCWLTIDLLNRDCTMAETLAKKIHGGHRLSATRMVNTVGKTITAYEAVPTSKLDIKRLLQLELSLEDKLTTIKQLDGEMLDLVEDDAVEGKTDQADDFKATVHTAIEH